jgi:hypothetical protein
MNRENAETEDDFARQRAEKAEAALDAALAALRDASTCLPKYGERRHYWRWDRARCEVCGMELADYVAAVGVAIAQAGTAQGKAQ